MLEQLMRFFRSPKEKVKNFKPLRHSFFKDKGLADILFSEGYAVVDFLSDKERSQLEQLFQNNHDFSDRNGVSFFSLFSSDLHYRCRIDDSIRNILSPTFEKWFVSYQNVVNMYIVKTPGQAGKVAIHQDASMIDEFKYSSINVWIPLQTVDMEDGPLCIIPRSHHISVPYRGSTIPPIAKNIESHLYPYFIPIKVKLGQAIFFDARMFHYSPPNFSTKNRIVVLSRINPLKAATISFFKPKEDFNSKIEMWRCPEDYFMKYNGFEDNRRPEGGSLLGYVNQPSLLNIEEFEKKRIALGIEIKNQLNEEGGEKQNFVREPIGIR